MTGQAKIPVKATEGLRAPQQARSQQSTDRMLDAALTILERDGMKGLSIAAVSRESGVSNGALYHRFGDRHSLLVAAQERFLDTVRAEWIAATQSLWSLDDRDELPGRLVDFSLRIFMQRRSLFYAFMVTGRADPVLRAGGTRMMKEAAEYFTSQLSRLFGCTPEAAGTAHQIMQAHAVFLVLFTPEETMAAGIDVEESRRHLVRAVRAVLGPGRSDSRRAGG